MSAPAAPSYTVGIDVGTQGAKAIIYDTTTHAVVGRGSASYGLLAVERPGMAEQEASTWLQGASAALHQALAQVQSGAEALRAVGVSGQQHGLVALDAAGEVVRPAKLWCDTESAAEAEELGKAFGWNMQAGFTCSKVLWLKRHEPESFARTAAVLLPHDWLNLQLTGRMAMECGDASGTGVLDVETREFRPDWCEAVDPRFQAMLPELIAPDSCVGTVTEVAAATLGLKAGMLVSTGSGDNMCSAIGAGATAEGRLVVSLGTSGTLFGYSARAVRDATGMVAPFCDATGGWLPLLCTMNCTMVVQEVCDCFNMGHEELTALAAAAPPGCGGLRFLPYLAGERSPNWPRASGAITGIRSGAMQPGTLYRAALEGASYSLLAGLHRLRELGLKAPTELLVVGGGAANRLWRQTLADAFGLPVRRPLEAESAALGAALQAAALAEGVTTAEYVARHPPGVEEEVLMPDSAAAEAHATNYAAFVREGRALFEQ